MIELFAKKEVSELNVCDEQQGKMIQRVELCRSLGLDIQAGVSEDLNPADAYQEISGYNLGIWIDYLPKFYSKRAGEWKDYRFDIIPHEVLEAAEVANGLHLFTDFEIWTAEQNDPVVVGVLGSHPERSRQHGNARFFLIARWGESLRPFESISQGVLRSRVDVYGKPVSPQTTNVLVEYLKKIFTSNEKIIVSAHGKFFKRHCGKQRRIVQVHAVNHNSLLVCPSCGDIAKS